MKHWTPCRSGFKCSQWAGSEAEANPIKSSPTVGQKISNAAPRQQKYYNTLFCILNVKHSFPKESGTPSKLSLFMYFFSPDKLEMLTSCRCIYIIFGFLFKKWIHSPRNNMENICENDPWLSQWIKHEDSLLFYTLSASGSNKKRRSSLSCLAVSVS